MNSDQIASLYEYLSRAYDEQELRTLCLRLPVQFDDLGGAGKSDRARELILWHERREQLEALQKALAADRPDQWARYASTLKPRDVETRVHERTGIEMIRIPAGEFLFGDAQARVDLPTYWISKAPVTIAQYEKFLSESAEHDEGSLGRLSGTDYPITSVNWFDANDFCAWAGLRLPTEQEWEKAARGVDGRLFPWGNEQPTSDRCNFNDYRPGISLVGTYSPLGDSPYGCVDMSGNVWEWTSSEFDPEVDIYFRTLVLKGGSYGSPANEVRCAERLDLNPGSTGTLFGFRVAVGA